MDFAIIDAWANPVFDPTNAMPEVARLFSQSHVDPELISRRRTPAEIVALMDAAGVTQICLTAWYRPGKAVFSNEDVAEFTRAFPARFIGIAGCDLMNPMGAIRDIRKYVKEEGFRGVRVVPWLWGLPPNDKHYWPLYAECIELNVPFVRNADAL
jgi:predicted TIM-barrel fold metal-dependent hydrolase